MIPAFDEYDEAECISGKGIEDEIGVLKSALEVLLNELCYSSLPDLMWHSGSLRNLLAYHSYVSKASTI